MSSSISKKDEALYGIPRPKKLKGNEISSSSTLAFTSQLSSLIASSSSSSSLLAGSKSRNEAPTTASGRRRPRKEDIFTIHNKNTKKRALKDIDDVDFSQKHSRSSEAIDATTLHRAKRKMEEKARLYAAMKRGDVEDIDDKYAVDFDRKWVEAQDAGQQGDHDDSSSGEEEEDDDDDEDEEQVEYVDEFGRSRTGTRAQAAREERRKNNATLADEPDRFTARPKMPDNVIFGDTIQAGAFNPDEPITAQMADLAGKRDKEATPPPDEHFDGSKEVRTKGVGFFQFSGEAEERKRQMDALDKERAETERRRDEVAKRKEDRKRELEERKKAIAEKRGKARADRFLDNLMGEIGTGTASFDQGEKSLTRENNEAS